MLGGIVKAESPGDGFLPMRASHRQASLDDATQIRFEEQCVLSL
jgi:hypothetical protein